MGKWCADWPDHLENRHPLSSRALSSLSLRARLYSHHPLSWCARALSRDVQLLLCVRSRGGGSHRVDCEIHWLRSDPLPIAHDYHPPTRVKGDEGGRMRVTSYEPRALPHVTQPTTLAVDASIADAPSVPATRAATVNSTPTDYYLICRHWRHATLTHQSRELTQGVDNERRGRGRKKLVRRRQRWNRWATGEQNRLRNCGRFGKKEREEIFWGTLRDFEEAWKPRV